MSSPPLQGKGKWYLYQRRSLRGEWNLVQMPQSLLFAAITIYDHISLLSMTRAHGRARGRYGRARASWLSLVVECIVHQSTSAIAR